MRTQTHLIQRVSSRLACSVRPFVLAAPSGKASHGNVETPIGSAYRLEFVSQLSFAAGLFFNLNAKRSAFV